MQGLPVCFWHRYCVFLACLWQQYWEVDREVNLLYSVRSNQILDGYGSLFFFYGDKLQKDSILDFHA